MKKLLFVFIVVVLASCQVSYEDSKVTNPEKTTVEMQNNIVDSCATLSYVSGSVYVMEDGLATHQFVCVDDDKSLVSESFMIIAIVWMVVSFFVGLAAITTD